MTLPIRRFLDASLRHLPPENQRQVLDMGDGGCFSSWPQPEVGAFVYVSEPELLAEYEIAGSVQRLFAAARAAGCDYILFDCEGPEIDGFELYPDWSEHEIECPHCGSRNTARLGDERECYDCGEAY